MGLFLAYFLICFGISQTLPFDPNASVFIAIVNGLLTVIATVCLASFFFVFPDGAFLHKWVKFFVGFWSASLLSLYIYYL